MDTASRIRRLKFRAWHRGTREADFMLGGFFDRYHNQWSDDDLAWFEALIEEDDVDVMAWALGQTTPPERFAGAQLAAMQKLDYVAIG